MKGLRLSKLPVSPITMRPARGRVGVCIGQMRELAVEAPGPVHGDAVRWLGARIAPVVRAPRQRRS